MIGKFAEFISKSLVEQIIVSEMLELSDDLHIRVRKEVS